MNLPEIDTESLPLDDPNDDLYYNNYFKIRCSGKYSGWYTCREQVAGSIEKELFFYSKSYEACIKRIRRLEKSLGIKSTFYKTKYKNVILIIVADFWLENDMRKSVFTAVLKDQNRYLRSKRAKKFLKLFKKGYTKTGVRYRHYDGVVDNIRYNPDDVEKLVRK